MTKDCNDYKMVSYKVSVFLALTGLYFLMVHGPSKWNESPPETIRTLIFKVLPMISLLSMVFYTKPEDEGHRKYKKMITWGLLFSLCGDMSLVWKTGLFKLGLLFFATAHVCYIVGLRFRPAGLGSGVFSMLSACVVFLFFMPRIKETLMQGLVAMYVGIIFTMFWRAHVRWHIDPRWDSLSATLGAVSFIVSDFILAFNKWHYEMNFGAVYVMATYYVAQLLISLSATLYSPYIEEEIREKKRG